MTVSGTKLSGKTTVFDADDFLELTDSEEVLATRLSGTLISLCPVFRLCVLEALPESLDVSGTKLAWITSPLEEQPLRPCGMRLLPPMEEDSVLETKLSLTLVTLGRDLALLFVVLVLSLTKLSGNVICGFKGLL